MSDRMIRINELMHLNLAEILQREIELPAGIFITITKVDCAPDLKTAKISLSVLPFDRAKEGRAAIIKVRNVIRKFLGRQLRNLKFVPELNFVIDDSEEKAGKINQLLDTI